METNVALKQIDKLKFSVCKIFYISFLLFNLLCSFNIPMQDISEICYKIIRKDSTTTDCSIKRDCDRILENHPYGSAWNN